MKIKSLFSLFVATLILISCHKNNGEGSLSPSLSFSKAHLEYRTSPLDSTTMVAYCVITLDFEDGQGDIGYSDNEKENIFPDGNDIYNDLVFRLHRIIGGRA